MPWNTFWLWFTQIALALFLLSPFAALFIWMVVGAVTFRLSGLYESRSMTDHNAGRISND